ncbi:SRPBCC family protein [Taklimakanibacter deserti]|uniref:SRPBCC family protein n=1 Tax=Taklimakanibacter deserti TaxID=2267839 RepID=UPI0034D44B4B
MIKASPSRIYEALLDPAAIVRWRPPKGMTAEVHAFDARPGGRFRMSFIYAERRSGTRGKTSEDADMFEGRFLELVPDRRVVELIEFQSDDPAFAGQMTVTTSLAPVAGGTEVTITCANVPPGISAEDHAVGMASTLANLATYTE